MVVSGSSQLQQWCYGLFAFSLLLLLGLETNAWLFPPVLSLAIGGGAVCAVLGSLRRKPTSRRYLLLTAGIFLLQIPIFCITYQAQDAISRNRANYLLRQLQTYHRQTGRYPDSLTQLVPKYLPAVPASGFGFFAPVPFYYVLEPNGTGADSAAYALGYGKGLFMTAIYRSRTQQWQVHE